MSITISFTTSNEHAVRMSNALCGPNERMRHPGESDAALAKRVVAGWIVQQVRRHEEIEAKKLLELNSIEVS